VWNQTEQAQTEHRLEKLKNYYNEYVEATNSEVLRLELQRLFLIQDTRSSTQERILKRDLYVADANSRFMEATNLDRRDVIGEPLTKFLPTASSLNPFLTLFVKNNFEVSDYIAPIVLPNGERRMYRHSMHAHCNSGLLVRVWYTREDVTDQQNKIVDAYKAAQQERNRISNVLHDKLASSLSGTGYALQCIIAMLDQKNPDLSSAQDTLTQIQDEVMKSTKETRHLSHSLSPVKMERDGLIDTIRSFLDSKESLHDDITFHFHHEGNPNDITDTSISDLIHMITSQAITNSIAHAQASEIHVDLLIDISSVRLEVTDNGTGLEDSQLWNAEGIGMMSMRHRVEARGGSFSLESTFNLGTTITAIVPLLT
jgi:signal transduction histidine kinase